MRVTLVALAAADPAKPSFPQQWNAMQLSDIQINQGGVPGPDGTSVCCEQNSPQCKIQTAHQADKFHFDFPNNRTRSGDPGQQGSIVSLYGSVMKEAQVSNNNTCISYCPLQFDLGEFALDDSAAYVGRQSLAGQDVDVWQWAEYLIPKLKIGIMQQTYFFVSTDDSPLPVREFDIIEPFGQKLGEENSTYSAFTPGKEPDTTFKVIGLDSCPMDPNCNSDSRQAHRMRGRDLRNLFAYKYPQAVIAAQKEAALKSVVV